MSVHWKVLLIAHFSASLHRRQDPERHEGRGQGQIKVRCSHLRRARPRGVLVQGRGPAGGEQGHLHREPGGPHQDRIQQHHQGAPGPLQPGHQEQERGGQRQVLTHRHRQARGARGSAAELHGGRHGDAAVEEDQG